jgi:hypothetical protein
LAKDRFRSEQLQVPDYVKLVASHNARRARR